MFRIYVILEIICVIHCLHYLYGKKICYTLPDGIFNYALILCQIIVFELMHIYNSWKGLSWIMLPLITVYTIIEFGANIKKSCCQQYTVYVGDKSFGIIYWTYKCNFKIR